MDDAGVNFQNVRNWARSTWAAAERLPYICALYGMEVIDSGVPVLSMHAPWEIVNKADVYEAAKAYKAFLMEYAYGGTSSFKEKEGFPLEPPPEGNRLRLRARGEVYSRFTYRRPFRAVGQADERSGFLKRGARGKTSLLLRLWAQGEGTESFTLPRRPLPGGGANG